MVKKIPLIVTLFLFSQFLFIFPSEAKLLPTHIKMVKVSQQNLLYNGIEITLTQYESKIAPLEIYNFYHDNLITQGWKIDFQSNNQLPYLLVFSNPQRETVSLDIYPTEEEKKCLIVLTETKGTTGPPQEDKDAKGNDLTWLSRYPNSVRQTDMEWNNGKKLVYITKASNIDLVVDFYRQQLVSTGWNLKSENRSKPQNKLDISQYLPDNIKIDKEQLEGQKVQIDEQVSSVFFKGNSLLLLSTFKVNSRIKTVLYYFYNYNAK
jgi:hypothetical protein